MWKDPPQNQRHVTSEMEKKNPNRSVVGHQNYLDIVDRTFSTTVVTIIVSPTVMITIL